MVDQGLFQHFFDFYMQLLLQIKDILYRELQDTDKDFTHKYSLGEVVK